MSLGFTSHPYMGYQGSHEQKDKGLVEEKAEPTEEHEAREMEAIP